VVLAVAVPLLVTETLPAEGRVGTLMLALLGYVYAVVLDARGGTLGKRLLKLRVVGPRGAAPGMGPAATRNLWLLTSLLPGLWGQSIAVAVSVALAVSIASHPARFGWHDRIAGTAVRAPA